MQYLCTYTYSIEINTWYNTVIRNSRRAEHAGCPGGVAMKRKKTLHDYLYENLREQIETGYYKYGEALPSMNRLCETYHVGIRTVRDVLSELRDQGMIRTEERRPAVIVYGKTGEEDYIPDILAVLQRKTSVLAVYKTMELLMPRMFALSVQVCGVETAVEYFKRLKRDRRKYVPDGRPHPMLFIICWMRPIICCSGIYSPVLRLAPEFLFSWSRSTRRPFPPAAGNMMTPCGWPRQCLPVIPG